MKPEAKELFAHFDQILDGTYKPKKKAFQHVNRLTRKVEWREEGNGDYLANRIPSLLEFLENRIHLREVYGVTMFKRSEKAPKHKPHFLPKNIALEEALTNLMLDKDKFHSSIVFESEQPLDQAYPRALSQQPSEDLSAFAKPTNKLVLPRFVNQPILLEPNRRILNTLSHNHEFMNKTVYKNVMQKTVFRQKKQISEMTPRIFEDLAQAQSPKEAQ